MPNTTERRTNQIEDFERLDQKIDLVAAEVSKLAAKISDDHPGQHEYIKKAMEREARRERLHQAIIEKTLTALVWSFIVGAGALFWQTIVDHWK